MRYYQNKYLIAVYDKEDNLIDVGNIPQELKIWNGRLSSNSQISHIFYKHRNATFYSNGKWLTVYFIDVTEKHDDCFAEEDEIFLNDMRTEEQDTFREISETYKINFRTLFRYYAKQKTKENLIKYLESIKGRSL